MNRPNANQDSDNDTLPKSKKNYELNTEKLSNGFVGSQFFLEGGVECGQGSKGKGDANIHQDSQKHPS